MKINNLDDFICRALELHVLTSDAWYSDGVAYPKLPWLSAELLPKLVRWATECKSSEFKSTLSLLPVEKYSLMYQQLKEKYKVMVKVKSARCKAVVLYLNCSRGLMPLIFRFGIDLYYRVLILFPSCSLGLARGYRS